MIRRAAVPIALVLVLAAVVAGTAWIIRPAGAPEGAPAAKFHCPMHPTVVSDRPGDCPICGMRLVPFEPATPEASPAAAPPERAPVRLPASQLARVGARTAPVTRAPFLREIRAAGRVAVDETRVRTITSKTAGFVERLWAGATGDRVRAGEPLLEVYSPELYAAQQELAVAVAARGRLAASRDPSVAASGDELVASARRRLALLDVPPGRIAEIEAGGEPRRTVVLDAPISGTILRRDVTPGMRIGPEAPLLQVADLSSVWVVASVFEYELPYVREGQRAAVALAYVPGRTFEGRVSKVYPTLDPASRTAQVRVELPNRSGELKPDMFGDVVLEADLGERVSVPSEAVLDTGVRTVVFVDRGEGLFEPREVTTGLRLPDRVEILAGVAPGESVLAAGTFFVDSESKLRAALSAGPR